MDDRKKVIIKRLGYRVTDDQGRIFEVVEKNGVTAEEGKTFMPIEDLIQEFFDRLTIKTFPLVQLKPPEPEKEKERPKELKGHALNVHLAAGIPFPTERQYRIITELDEFTIQDIGELFATKPDVQNELYDRKKIVDNAYHDVADLLEYNKIQLIEGSHPKKYKVIDKSPDGLRTKSVKSIIKDKKIDLATHKEVLIH